MQTSAERIWSAAQEHLRSMLSADIYNLWFAPLRACAQENDSITLEVANDFCEVWLKDNYMGLLQDVIALSSGRQLQVKFKVGVSSGPAALAPQPVHGKKKATEPAPERAGNNHDLNFNPKNTFDTFVVGNNNNFAYAAALAVAQAPGKSYNPLFLYGGVGLGKTHLLHAIGQHVVVHKKGARVAFVSSEKFTNEYIDGIQNNQLARFRKKYRQTDVLLIDDIQFLAGKERIQEEFFHTFNALHEGHKQIVLTCDRPASEIQNLEHRLVSRFEWGLVTDLQPPDVEMRLAILAEEGADHGRAAARRDHAVPCQPDSHQHPPTGRRVDSRGLLRRADRQEAEPGDGGGPAARGAHEEGRYAINIEVIQKRVAEHFDIRLADMTSKRRPENIAFPRQVAMFLSRQMTDTSLSAIGEAFGGRDHGTVLHACRLVKDRMEVDPNVRQVVSYLEKQLMR